MTPSEKLIRHKNYHMVAKKFGAQPVGAAIQKGNSEALAKYLAYADSVDPGVRRMIVNGEWVDVQTDYLGDEAGSDAQEWPAYVDHGEAE